MDVSLAARADAQSPAAEPLPAGAAAERLLHPCFVLRVSGLAADAIAPLRAPAPRRILDAARAAQAQARDDAAAAIAGLEAAIGDDACDQGLRRLLLRGKRNLFNGRPSGLDAAAQAALAPALAAAIDRADRAVAHAAATDRDFDAAFAEAGAAARPTLRRLCADSETLTRAIAYSAPLIVADLFEALAQPAKFDGKRGRNLDLALFNYLTRATVKVSPLTFFTPVLVGRWAPAGSVGLDGRLARSRVSVGRRFLLRLLDAMTRDLRLWGDSHGLRLNPTLIDDGEAIVFTDLFARGPGSARTWGLYPPTVRIATTPRLRALIDAFGGPGSAAPLSLRALFGRTRATLPDLAPPAFAALVAQALSAGALLPDIALFEQEHDAAELAALVRPRAPDLADQIDAFAGRVGDYAGLGGRDRPAQFEAIRAAASGLAERLKIGGIGEVKSPLFYEDCALDGPAPAAPPEALGVPVADLHRLAELFPLLDFNNVVQSVSAGLFRQTFGADAEVAADDCLFDLAERAQRIASELTPLSAERQADALRGIAPAAAELVLGKAALLAFLRAGMDGGRPFEIDEAALARFAGRVPAAVRARPMSYNVIGQQADRDGPFVINRLYSGHSLLMSRFMTGQPPAFAAAIGAYLQRLAGAATPVELPGVFGFNANVHPPFTAAELSFPERRPGFRDTRKIPLAEVRVAIDPVLDRLRFTAGDGSDLSIHYFGFLNLMILPPIYQILGRAHGQGLILDTWQDLLFAGLLDPRVPAALGRTSFGRVVVSRAGTVLPPAALPSGRDEPAFFRGLHATFADHGVAADSYIRLIPDRLDFSDEADESMADTTDFKPAFLSLDIPLSVAALQRRLARRPRAVLVQEALPRVGDGGIDWDGRRHSCEIQIEIARTGGQA